MRGPKIVFVLTIVALLAIGICALFLQRPEGTPVISISLLGYTNWHGYTCARILLTNKGTTSVSYDSQATGPAGWLKQQSTNGWSEGGLSCMTGAPVLLAPGGSIQFSTVLSTNTVHWQFAFMARTASLAERAFFQTPGRWWHNIPILHEWPLLLPRKTGIEQEIKSEIFVVREGRKESDK